MKLKLIDFRLKQNLQEEQVLTNLLQEHKDIFASRLEHLGKTYLAKDVINTRIAAPVRQGLTEFHQNGKKNWWRTTLNDWS